MGVLSSKFLVKKSGASTKALARNMCLALILVPTFAIGVAFEKTAERYTYKIIDFIWSLKSPALCSNDEVLSIPIKRREPIRDKNLVETHDDWKVLETIFRFCPKNTALLLIDVWDTTLEETDVIRNEHERIINDVIIPVSAAVRQTGGTVIHSPNGSPIYPSSYNPEFDINLGWTDRLPRKLQTIMLFWTLRSQGIDTLIYAGFSTNICLYDRPHGIYFTKLFDEYIDRLLLRDGTTTFEFSSELPTFTDNFINYLEWQHLPSFSSSEFARET